MVINKTGMKQELQHKKNAFISHEYVIIPVTPWSPHPLEDRVYFPLTSIPGSHGNTQPFITQLIIISFHQ